jgi:hypothetical protein
MKSLAVMDSLTATHIMVRAQIKEYHNFPLRTELPFSISIWGYTLRSLTTHVVNQLLHPISQ